MWAHADRALTGRDKLTYSGPAQTVVDAVGLRQVRTPGVLADIVDDPNSPDAYWIDFYLGGSTQNMQGLYVPDAAHAAVSWRIDLPASPPTGVLQLTKSVWGTTAFVAQKRYVYSYDTSGCLDPNTCWEWTVSTYDGQTQPVLLRSASVAWEQDPNTAVWTRTYTAEDGSANVLSKSKEQYEEFAWGLARTDRWVRYASGLDLHTEYEYYESGNAEGKLRLITQPDESWTGYYYEYDGSGALTARVVLRPWKNSDPPANFAGYATDTTVQATKTVYVTDPNDPGLGRVDSVTEYAAGTGIGETTYGYTEPTQDVLSIAETHSGPGGQSFVTITKRDLANDERTLSVWSPDGRFTRYVYEEDGYLDPNATTNPVFYPGTPGAYTRVRILNGYSTDGSTGKYPLGLATQQTTVRNGAGQVILTETYTTSPGDPNQYDTAFAASLANRLQWTLYSYDGAGRESARYHHDGTYRITAWDESSCCGTRTVTDEHAITMEYVYDALGRLTLQTRSGANTTGGLAQDLITQYDYDFVSGERVFQTVLDYGGTNLTSTRHYDLAGRLTGEVDPVGLTTSYDYTNVVGGGRRVTTAYPSGGTAITEYYRDGRTKSVSGSAVVQRVFDYAPFTTTEQTFYVPDPNDPNSIIIRTSTRTVDLLGRTANETRPAYPSGIVTTSYDYFDPNAPAGSAGHLSQVVTEDASGPVEAATVYEYNKLGQQVASGLNIDGSPGLDPASADRFQTTSSTFQYESNAWWRVTESITYGSDPNGVPTSTPITLSVQKQRLTGFSAGVIAESISTDVAGNETTSVTTLNRSVPSTTTTIDYPDSTTNGVQYAVNGYLVTSTSRSGNTTTYERDKLGRQTAVIDGRGVCTATEYDAAGRVESVIEDPNGLAVTSKYAYYGNNEAGAGQVKSVTQDPNGAKLDTYYAYTLRGELEKVWGDVPYPTLSTYDGFGQRTGLTTYRGGDFTGETWPGGTGDTTAWSYHGATGLLERKTYADTTHVDYTYTTDGKLHQRTWARGATTTYGYDEDTGELTSIDYSDPNTPDVGFTYDRLGRARTVSDALGTRIIGYDPLSLQQATETFDGAGLLNGKRVTRVFDPNLPGRLGGLQVGTSGDVDAYYAASYDYDPDTGRMWYANGPGMPPIGTYRGVWYDYEPGSDLIRQTQFYANTPWGQSTKTYEPNRNALDAVENNIRRGPTIPVIAKYDYTTDDLGRRSAVAYSGPAFASSPITESFGYNDRNELTGSSRTDDSNLARGYVYDPIGNRTKMWEGPDPNSHPVKYLANSVNQYGSTLIRNRLSQGIEYDDDGNLTEMFVAGDMNCNGSVDFFDIDCWLDALAGCPGINNDPNYACYPCDCLHGDFDGDGDVDFFDNRLSEMMGASATSAALGWDAENRLISYEPVVPQTGEKRVKFGYDYQGRRVRKTVEEYDPNAGWTPAADTAFVWDGWKLLLEVDLRDPNDPNDDFISWKYTWGLDLAGQSGQVNSLEGAGTIGGLLAMQDMDDPNDPSDPNDATGRFACFYDGNGNLTQLLHLGTWDPNNPEVAIRAHYEYDPYGNIVRQTGSYAATNPWRFSTKQFDAETGLGCWGYRYYSPALGRWVSRDPIGEGSSAALYLGLHNNPLTWVDPNGNKETDRPGDEEEKAELLRPDEVDWRFDDTCVIGKCRTGGWLGLTHGSILVRNPDGTWLRTEITGDGPGIPCCCDHTIQVLNITSDEFGAPYGEAEATKCILWKLPKRYCQCMTDVANKWKNELDGKICYHQVRGPNCNSYVGCLMRACGLRDYWFGVRLWGENDFWDHGDDDVCSSPDQMPAGPGCTCKDGTR